MVVIGDRCSTLFNIINNAHLQMGRATAFPTRPRVRPARTRIYQPEDSLSAWRFTGCECRVNTLTRLRKWAVWSEYSLGAHWILYKCCAQPQMRFISSRQSIAWNDMWELLLYCNTEFSFSHEILLLFIIRLTFSRTSIWLTYLCSEYDYRFWNIKTWSFFLILRPSQVVNTHF